MFWIKNLFILREQLVKKNAIILYILCEFQKLDKINLNAN